jgi:hypothetical protein
MPLLIKAGETTAALKAIPFRLVATSDGFSPVTGATVTIKRRLNGTNGSGAGTVTEVSSTDHPGVYLYNPDAAEIASTGSLIITPSATGAAAVSYEALIVTEDPYASAATTAAIADAVWDEARSGHVTAGSFGEGVASVQGNVTGNVGGNVTGSVGSLAAQAKTDVNTEVLDVLNVDTFAQPASVPAATTTLRNMLGWLYTLARNKHSTTATSDVVRNDADSGNIASATLSDNGTTFTRGQYT